MTVFRLVRLFYEATTAHGVEVHQRGQGHRGGMDIGEAEDGNGDHIILCIECAKLLCIRAVFDPFMLVQKRDVTKLHYGLIDLAYGEPGFRGGLLGGEIGFSFSAADLPFIDQLEHTAVVGLAQHRKELSRFIEIEQERGVLASVAAVDAGQGVG